MVKQIESQTKTFLHRQQVRLTKEQFEGLLDVMHPKLVKLYWPVSGAVNTMRQQGISGILKKIRKRFGKGGS